jgi:hypothetical protein
LILLGIASLVVAYGLFKGKTWSWTVAVVLSTIGLVVNVSQHQPLRAFEIIRATWL